jgi:alpha-acetolactate decarboxylase
VFDPYRSSLSSTTVEASICTQDWVKIKGCMASNKHNCSNSIDGSLKSDLSTFYEKLQRPYTIMYLKVGHKKYIVPKINTT